jgi:transcriptional regulator with XRE-family HTH domain
LSPRPPPDPDIERLVRLDGLAVRRRRHDHGWSLRDLTSAIETASFDSTGLRRTLTPNQLQAIEERGERIPYASALLLADGLDCDPSDLIADDELSSQRRGHTLH